MAFQVPRVFFQGAPVFRLSLILAACEPENISQAAMQPRLARAQRKGAFDQADALLGTALLGTGHAQEVQGVDRIRLAGQDLLRGLHRLPPVCGQREAPPPAQCRPGLARSSVLASRQGQPDASAALGPGSSRPFRPCSIKVTVSSLATALENSLGPPPVHAVASRTDGPRGPGRDRASPVCAFSGRARHHKLEAALDHAVVAGLRNGHVANEQVSQGHGGRFRENVQAEQLLEELPQ